MASLLRTSLRVSRVRPFSPTFAAVPRRFAGDYGSVQSGQEQGIDEKNPMKHMEHPGPESPASKGKASSSSDSSTSSSSSSSKDAPQPKISNPEAPSQDQNADVRKHNEDMDKRADKSTSQASKGNDEKVKQGFWEGDVGDMKNKND